jgi:hypothetical protein
MSTISAHLGQSVSFINQADSPVVDRAVELFLQHYKDDAFLAKVKKSHFFCTIQSGKKIAKKIAQDHSKVTLQVFTEDSNTVAKTSIKAKRISFNKNMLTKKNSQTEADLIARRLETLMHEYVHTLGYKHWTNANNYINRLSPPYKVAKIFIQHLNKMHVAF